MAKRNVAGVGLALAVLVAATNSAFAAVPPAASASPTPMPAAKPAPRPARPLVPADFSVPTRVEGPGFTLVPLGPEVVKLDYDAYMSSVEHLQKTFSRSPNWPRQGISQADAMRDMEGEQGRFQGRKSFAYAVLSADGKRERGSVYVSPSSVAGYDAVVRMWVTQADYDAGFDAELYRWVSHWIATDWPFAKVAYPGRAIAWDKWDAMVGKRPAKPAG